MCWLADQHIHRQDADLSVTLAKSVCGFLPVSQGLLVWDWSSDWLAGCAVVCDGSMWLSLDRINLACL